MKITVFEVLSLSCCCYGMLTADGASEENVIHGDSMITLPHQTNLLNRVKRQGGGGIIPFRPLFVYRQEQRERQERWKEIEARKKLREQWLEHQQYEDVIKQNQQSHTSHRPPTPSISYSSPTTTQYTSYNYPYTRYKSYSPSSYYNQYEYDKYQKDPYANYYRKYYQNYYSGYYDDDDDYLYSYF